MPLSCHVFRVSSAGRRVLPEFLEELSKKRVHRAKLGFLGDREFNIVFSRVVSSVEGLHFYVMEYPEPLEFIDYETEKRVVMYKKESARIVYVNLGDDYAFVFICGRNVAAAKRVIEKIASPRTGGDYALVPFSISSDELEYLVKEYGLSVKYAKHHKTKMTDLDKVALWGSDVTRNPLYLQLKSMSRDPNREVRISDSLYSYKGLGVIGITRQHEKTKALAVRVWSNLAPDILAEYLLTRIIKPIVEKRSGGLP